MTSRGQGLAGRALACIRGEKTVFSGLDLAVAPGSVLLLSGPNGSGKSSLLRVLAGLLPPAAGRIEWDGADVAAEPEAYRAQLAYVGHADPVKPALTVAENLAFWFALNRHGGAVEAALARFGVAALAELPARYLSAGQRRRLTLARLAGAGPREGGPRLWLLDEPATGLDEDAVGMLAAAIGAHLAQSGLAVIASHGGALDAALADRASRLRIGGTAA